MSAMTIALGSWRVNETVVTPFAFAASIARATFTDRPEVEMPMSTSPAFPSASTCREKTVSYP
jgi:hypothetical protein